MILSKTQVWALSVALSSMMSLNAGAVMPAACPCGKPPKQAKEAQVFDENHQILPVGCSCGKPAKPKDGFEIEQAACTRCKPKALPRAKEAAIYKQMALVAQKTKRALSQTSSNKNIIKTLESRGLCSNQFTAFPKAPNFIQEISPNADTITLENGSAWAIAEADQLTARSWTPGAALVITPNKLSIWAKITKKEMRYKYCFVNLDTKASVQTNLSLGPFAHNPYTLKIRKLNPATGEVSFTNGTLWRLDTSKISAVLLKDWEAGDYVMPGNNTTWFGFGLPDIVINVTRDNWLPAQRLY